MALVLNRKIQNEPYHYFINYAEQEGILRSVNSLNGLHHNQITTVNSQSLKSRPIIVIIIIILLL